MFPSNLFYFLSSYLHKLDPCKEVLVSSSCLISHMFTNLPWELGFLFSGYKTSEVDSLLIITPCKAWHYPFQTRKVWVQVEVSGMGIHCLVPLIIHALISSTNICWTFTMCSDIISGAEDSAANKTFWSGRQTRKQEREKNRKKGERKKSEHITAKERIKIRWWDVNSGFRWGGQGRPLCATVSKLSSESEGHEHAGMSVSDILAQGTISAEAPRWAQAWWPLGLDQKNRVAGESEEEGVE